MRRRGGGGGGAVGSRWWAALLAVALVLVGLWARRVTYEGRGAAAPLASPHAEGEQQGAAAEASLLERFSRAKPIGLTASASVLFASDEPPVAVRPAAISRMAAKLRDDAAATVSAAFKEAASGTEAPKAAAAVAKPAKAASVPWLQAPKEPAQAQAQPQAASANTSGSPAASSNSTCHPSLVVFLTSHKTGTAQAGCIVEMVEQRYMPAGAFRHDHHPDTLHAASAFAQQALAAARSGAAACPPALFYASGHHLPRLEDEACPGTLPCPCVGEQEQCLSLEPGTVDIPAGNTTVVQVIRQPINVVLSAYQYHIQDPPPKDEAWLHEMSMSNFTGWAYSGGVPYAALEALGAPAAPNASYYAFLRSLPPEQGVKLQFWLSAWELFGFARQYASLAGGRQPGLAFLPIRFEDLQARASYNATVEEMLEAVRERLPALDVPWTLGEVQACHISSWNASHLAQHEHITSQRDPALRQRLRPVLMADPEIGPRLCQLGRMFGYPPEPECAGTPAATAAEGGTAGSQGAAAGAAAMSEPPEAAASGAAAGGGGGGGGEAGVVEQGEMQD